MKWVWTWGGESFGYIDGDDLWTYDGRHVGRLSKGEIYGPSGNYLGEVMSDDRLISHRSKRSQRGVAFTPYARRSPYVRYANYVGYAMYAGYEDFPSPGEL